MFPTSTTGTIPLVGAGVGWSSVDVSALKKKVRIEITKKHTVNKFLRYHSNTYVTKQMCKYTNIWDILCVYKYTNTLPSTMDHTFKTSVLYRKPPHKKKKKHLWNLLLKRWKLGSPNSPRCSQRSARSFSGAAALLGAATPPFEIKKCEVEWLGAQGRINSPYPPYPEV